MFTSNFADAFSYLEEEPVQLMNKNDSDNFYAHLISKPTDRIEMSDELNNRMISIVRKITGQKPDDQSVQVPTDIVFADNIPIKSLEFNFKCKEPGRVILFDDKYRHAELQEVVNGIKQEAAIGIVSIYVPIENSTSHVELFCTIYVKADINNLLLKPEIGLRGNKEIIDMIYSREFDISSAATMLYVLRFMFTIYWYGLNVILQNPVLKECVTVGREVINQKISKKQHKGGKQPPKKYIRRIYINPNKVDANHINSKHTITKSLWYVTGHWRRYSSGKRIFIQGYWKGAARDLKNGETRDREIVFDNN